MPDSVVTALIALVGALVGAAASLGGQVLVHHLQVKTESRKDEPRKKLLRTMLDDQRFKWRKLSTLMHVIGADADTAKRLLLDLDARASEDGQELWGLQSRNPLDSQ